MYKDHHGHISILLHLHTNTTFIDLLAIQTTTMCKCDRWSNIQVQ